MKKIISLILFLILIIDNESYSSEYNYIADSSGQVVYLEINKNEISEFLRKFIKNEIDLTFSLKTLIISDIEDNRSFKTSYPILLKFLKNNCPTLENLHIINSKNNEGDLELVHLIDILKSIKNAPIKDFRWENQDEIDDSDRMEFFNRDSENVLSKVNYLSFKNTEFDEDSFFLTKINFHFLCTLDLTQSLDSEDLFKNMVVNHSQFSELKHLILDGNELDFEIENQTIIPFPKLKKLSLKLFDHSSKDYIRIINDFPILFQNLDTLKIKLKSKKNDNYNPDGEFILNKNNSIATDNLGYTKKVIEDLPALRSIGGFRRFNSTDTTNINKYFKNTEINPAIFFTNIYELKYFEKVYPISKRSVVTLAGPYINETEIKYILSNNKAFQNIKQIYLIATSCSDEKLNSLRLISKNKNILIHKIDNFQSTLISSIFNNSSLYMWDMWHMHQLHNMQMQQIQKNIPKYK